MSNAYSAISIPEGYNFTKGGVFILAHPSISNSLTTTLNPELNENCVLVSCSPSQSINNWGKSLSNNVKDGSSISFSISISLHFPNII